MRAIAVKIGLFLLIFSVLLPPLDSSGQTRMYSKQVAVLAYHHLSDTAKSNVTITPELFREQLDYLKKHNYRFITLAQFKQFLQGGAVPDNAVLVTFDDGYESFYQYGYPILQELGIPAVNFVITGDLDNPQGTTIPSLSKSEIERMVKQPNFIDVQCHSDRLHAMVNNNEALLTSFVAVNGTLETEEQYERRIVRDTDQCIDKLSVLYPAERPTTIDFYAYPFGDYDAEASRLVQESGIRYAFTVVSEMSLQTDDPLQIPRITAGNPSITPERLHQSIMRKVVDLQRTFDYIPLRDGVGQIGGTFLQNGDGNISFNYHEQSWIVHADTMTITKDGQSIPLEHPLKVTRRRLYIDFHDLERVMNVHITYDPVNEKFYERVTPAR